jgi:hypothetical protein
VPNDQYQSTSVRKKKNQSKHCFQASNIQELAGTNGVNKYLLHISRGDLPNYKMSDDFNLTQTVML